jgi:GPH family glycoside/pentoside/hexuronide:cation symporter
MSNHPASSQATTNDCLKPREYIGYAWRHRLRLLLQTFNIFLTYYYVVCGDSGDRVALVVSAGAGLRRIGRCDHGPHRRPHKHALKRSSGRICCSDDPYGICGYLMFAGPDFGPTGKITYAAILRSAVELHCHQRTLSACWASALAAHAHRHSTCRFIAAFGAAFLIAVCPSAGEAPRGRARFGGFN